MGNAGANVIRGGGGADALLGLGGNDEYYVGDAAERVIEAGGGGRDVIYASVDYVLGAGSSVEVLSTDSLIGTSAIDLTGNELAQEVRNAGPIRLAMPVPTTFRRLAADTSRSPRRSLGNVVRSPIPRRRHLSRAPMRCFTAPSLGLPPVRS